MTAAINYANTINTDRALSTILSRFETNTIYNIVEENIRDRWRPYGNNVPTLKAFDDMFRSVLSNTDDSQYISQINDVRHTTYLEILSKVCEYYHLDFNIPDGIDLYGITYWIYQYFVSDFTNTLVDFYCNFIYREKSQLYANLQIEHKPRDASSAYAKKVLNNTDKELIAIHANISNALDLISGYNISLEQFMYFTIAISNPDVYNVMINVLHDRGNTVYDNFFCYLFSPISRDDLITTVKLELQRRFG